MPILKTEIFLRKMEAIYIYEINMEPPFQYKFTRDLLKVILTLNIQENILNL